MLIINYAGNGAHVIPCIFKEVNDLLLAVAKSSENLTKISVTDSVYNAHPGLDHDLSPEKRPENAKLLCCLKYLLIAQFEYDEFQ